MDSPGGAAVAALPVASAVRVVRSGDITRLAFDLTSPIDVRAFVMANPDRVIVDVPETIFAIEVDAGQRASARRGAKADAAHAEGAPAGLISSYRFGKLGAGRSRIVIDLAKPARVVKAGTELSEEGRLRLLVDLAPTDRAAFSAAAAEAMRSAAPRAQQAAGAVELADSARPVVVIDPGHGGIDVGAMAKGRAPEKEIVFAFAKALEAALLETGRYSVVLTRTDDVFVPLGDRVQIARAANAQLFLSIHADTLNEGGVSGATVYTVSDKASDAHAARLAEKENFADQVAGFDGAEEASGVSDILFDLTRRETRAYSHVFARTLVNVWKEAARLNKNPVRSAGFKVLKAPDVPSALLELGYLSSEKDSALLTDPEWRAKTASAVARSIDQFFAMRTPKHAAEETGGVASIVR
ncbi:MAG: N-acetylmuramoyl-L-alanine amidase [Beijerinckiaceae bacterium]